MADDKNQNQMTPYSRTEVMLRERGNMLMQMLPGAFANAEDRKTAVARFMRQVMTACQKNPALLDAHPESLWLAASNLCAAGLDPSGQGGEAAMVPYGNIVTPIIMARGYVMLAIRSGAARAIEHNVVCEGDMFEFEFGSAPFLRHRPALSGRGKPVAVWAIATLAIGEKVYEVMGWGEVDAIRIRSKAGKGGPWATDPLEMGRKTVLRRIIKRIPWDTTTDMIAKMLEIQAADDEAFGLDTERSEIKQATANAPQTGMAALKAKVMPKETATEAPGSPVEPRESEGGPDGGAKQERPAGGQGTQANGKIRCHGCGRMLPPDQVDLANKVCIECASEARE